MKYLFEARPCSSLDIPNKNSNGERVFLEFFLKDFLFLVWLFELRASSALSVPHWEDNLNVDFVLEILKVQLELVFSAWW